MSGRNRTSRWPAAHAAVSRIAFAALLCAFCAAPAQARQHKRAAKPVPAEALKPLAPSDRPDADAMLIGIYKELAANRLNAAQAKADALVAAYPKFRLGHLIRGDLLMMHARPVTTFGAAPAGADDKLKDLREEAIVRLRSLRERPDPDLVPRAILQLREDQKYALMVDAKRSRLYVYENRAGQLKFVTDYYISQGKLGINKLKAGDQKTPIGVYHITARLKGKRLPDFYGTGALPINYPNEWDRLNGRSGSGIWLHGTPSDSYSRPPLSSDGCVVLANQDLSELYASVEIGKTPVVISEQVEFVNTKKRDSDRNVALKLVENWRRDFESKDLTRLMGNYSLGFKSERGENLAAWQARHQQMTNGARQISLKLRDLSFFFYPGRDDMMVGMYTEDMRIDKQRHSVRKRQYWAKEGVAWKIISESAL